MPTMRQGQPHLLKPIQYNICRRGATETSPSSPSSRNDGQLLLQRRTPAATMKDNLSRTSRSPYACGRQLLHCRTRYNSNQPAEAVLAEEKKTPADTSYFINEAVFTESCLCGDIRQTHIAKNPWLPWKSKSCCTGGIRETYDTKGSTVALKIQAVMYGSIGIFIIEVTFYNQWQWQSISTNPCIGTRREMSVTRNDTVIL